MFKNEFVSKVSVVVKDSKGLTDEEVLKAWLKVKILYNSTGKHRILIKPAKDFK